MVAAVKFGSSKDLRWSLIQGLIVLLLREGVAGGEVLMVQTLWPYSQQRGSIIDIRQLVSDISV